VEWGRWAPISLLLGLLLLILSVVAFYSLRRIMPGVRCLGLDLGGMTRSQAAAMLEANWQERRVYLDTGEHGVEDAERLVSPLELGLRLDTEATVEAALRRGWTLARLGARKRGQEAFEVEPTVVYDAAAVLRQLERVRAEVYLEPTPEVLRLGKGRVEVVPPRQGRALDVGATARRLQGAPVKVVQAGYLELAVEAVKAPDLDLAAVAEQANRWLTHALLVEVFDPIAGETLRWRVEPAGWSAWVGLALDDDRLAEGAAALEWSLDVSAARAALEEQLAAWVAGGQLFPSAYVDLDAAAALVRDAVLKEGWLVHLRAYHHGSQHTVRSGETLASIAREVGIPYPWLQEANPGVGDNLQVGQVIEVPSPDVLLPLPVVEEKRIVVSISEQRMWAYQDGEVVWEWVVSTGIPSSPTAPGVFQVQSHDGTAYAASWDLWMPYFVGIYRPVPSSSFMNGFHGFPTRDGATLLWTGNLGYPVTFGCILLDTRNAELLYGWAEEGVVVEIQP
jgi:LysM repeat protein